MMRWPLVVALNTVDSEEKCGEKPRRSSHRDAIFAFIADLARKLQNPVHVTQLTADAPGHYYFKTNQPVSPTDTSMNRFGHIIRLGNLFINSDVITTDAVIWYSLACPGSYTPEH